MEIEIKKWGNSLALRIPKAFAKEISMVEGTKVEVALKKGAMIVTPRKRKQYTLAELVAQMKPSKRHAEHWDDAPRGKEVW